MKKIVLVSLVAFALSLSGCATTTKRWNYHLPPGGTQAGYEKDKAYCDDYTRTWCATNGTMVLSGSRQDYQWGQWGQRDVRVSGNRGCDQEEFNTVCMDCLRMKGYTFTPMEKGQGKRQEKTTPPISRVERQTGQRYVGEFPPGISADHPQCFWELDRSKWVDGKRPPPQLLEWVEICR